MGQVIVGFDIEWKTTFTKICGNTSLCHVMHTFHSGITSLQFLLEDSTLVKVGVGISGDCAKVLRDYNVSVKSVEDLSYHANQKLGGEPKTCGLCSSKDSCLQRESDLETGKQMFYQKNNLQYAATDAMVSWKLYQVLKSLPDAKDAPLTIQDHHPYLVGPWSGKTWLHLGKLRRERSDMHGTQGVIFATEITKSHSTFKMYFQKQNLEYYHVS
ncbi:hypothetical protein NC651_003216 [Populus alba x Populus x berolinensis]|nr:hypothetical protein NC651_003216 [Populus alba x Populus x berolinensis]